MRLIPRSTPVLPCSRLDHAYRCMLIYEHGLRAYDVDAYGADAHGRLRHGFHIALQQQPCLFNLTGDALMDSLNSSEGLIIGAKIIVVDTLSYSF